MLTRVVRSYHRATLNMSKAKRPADSEAASPNAKKLKGAASTLDGIALPEGWFCHDKTLLMHEYMTPVYSSKIAAFDFDGCLAKTSLFKKGPDAWSMLTPKVPKYLQDLHKDGYRIVVCTNQAGIGKATKTKDKAILEKTGRLNGFLRDAGVPALVLMATAKTTVEDKYRKPASGMWEFIEQNNGGTKVDKTKSFFVGDAAGRKGDHSDSDKKFAEGVGIEFRLETVFK